MSGRVSLGWRGIGLLLVLAGGGMLPGFTAAAGKPRPASKVAPPAPAKGAAAAERAPAPRPAAPPPGNRIMSVREVRPGMKGYGLTVFRGTTVERFDVEVVGVMPKAYMGQPLVLVRLSGGPITERGAYLIQGMSGSPIYIDGKLLGAFSMGNAWPKEPLGMVTPIEDMLEALDPKLSEVPAGEVARAEPLSRAGAASADGALFRSPFEELSVLAAGQTFRPLALPVAVSGLSGRNLELAARALAPFNMTVMQGPGSMPEPFRAELTPGAAMGVALMTGDVEMTGIGTVTYRNGDRILGFGHPMMQIGAAQFPLTTAWIHEVFPGLQSSFKIGSAGEVCGTITQDRPFGVAGRLGKAPEMVPIRCEIRDIGTGRSRTVNVRAANHPLLVGQLLPLAVNQALMNVRPVPGDVVAYVRLKAETEGAGTIRRDNVFYDPVQIDVAAVRELQELMRLLTSNPFRRVPVKRLDLEVTFEDKLPTATIERIYLAQDRVEPGEEVEVGIVLRPYRKEPVVLKSKLRVPENATSGQAVLLVQGGATRVTLSGSTTTPGSGMLPSAPPPDASLRQILKRFTDREKNNQIVVRLLFPSAAININGERLSQLPSTIVDLMRSSKSTGFRIERDEVKALQDTDYIVQGVQTLQLSVQRKDSREKGSASSRGSSAGGVSLPSSESPSRGSLSTGEEGDDELSTLHLIVDGEPRLLRLTPEMEETELDPEPEPAKKPEPKAGQNRRPASQPSAAKPGETPGAAGGRAAAPARPAAETPDSKLVGRQASVWTQTSQADFERGTLTNTAVNTRGEVQLAPALSLVYEGSEQFVWSVVGMNGAIYAGTGNGGQVLRIDGNGKATVLLDTDELEVHALAKDSAGNLYAGTSPNGKIFRIRPDGQATELYSMNGDASADEAGAKFVLALAAAPDGTIYAGTGPNGRLLRIRPGASAAEPLCTLPDRSITSLAVGPDGTLYAGTAEEGAIYRIRPGAAPESLYDTDQAVITGLALDGEGNVYAACAPSGQIYRIAPDGTARLHFSKGKGALFGLLADRAGNLITGSDNALLRVEPDGDATLLTDRRNGQFTCLAWDETGRIIAGSSNIGSVYRLAPVRSGVFESTVHDAKAPARWGRIRFTGVAPEGAEIAVETRSGNTPEPDATWSAWEKPIAREGGLFVASPPARFLQYRILFQGERGAPAMRDVSIYYLPKNQPPKLTLAAPAGGEILHGNVTLRWSASDPDGDTLTYEAFYSADGGRTWKPLGEPVEGAASASEPSAPQRPTRASAEDALKRYREQLEADRSLSPQQREESLQKARALVERFLAENPESGNASGSARPAPSSSAAARRPASTRQASIGWDTRQVPDGIYLLKVVATDRASNPGEPLSDEKVTEPVIVCNTPPQLFLFSRGIEVDAQKKTAQVVGFGAGRVSLKGAQYRLGNGEWTAIEPEDGIWDSAFEHFRFEITPEGQGEQELEVKAVDAAGNVSVTKVRFKGS